MPLPAGGRWSNALPLVVLVVLVVLASILECLQLALASRGGEGNGAQGERLSEGHRPLAEGAHREGRRERGSLVAARAAVGRRRNHVDRGHGARTASTAGRSATVGEACEVAATAGHEAGDAVADARAHSAALGGRRDERQALAVALDEEEAHGGHNGKANQDEYDGAGGVAAAFVAGLLAQNFHRRQRRRWRGASIEKLESKQKRTHLTRN